MRVLLVEDEKTIREVEKAYLKKEGYTVIEATNGQDALEFYEQISPNIIVLDLNLPKIDGIEVCKRIREKDMHTPIIMVTARAEEVDEILGLEIGADDYLKKPFSPKILVARVKALLKRTGSQVTKIRDIVIDPGKMNVKLNGKSLMLTSTQFKILKMLASKPGEVFSRETIMERIYGKVVEYEVLERTIDAHVKAIRKALGDNARNPKYIQTKIGAGYTFLS